MAIVRLNSIVNRLEDIRENIESKIDDLREKQEAIEAWADEYDRDLTDVEQTRYDKIEDDISELEYEIDSIDNALDYLRDYTD